MNEQLPSPSHQRPPTVRSTRVLLQAVVVFTLLGFLIVAVPCLGLTAGKEPWDAVLVIAASYGSVGAVAGMSFGSLMGVILQELVVRRQQDRL